MDGDIVLSPAPHTAATLSRAPERTLTLCVLSFRPQSHQQYKTAGRVPVGVTHTPPTTRDGGRKRSPGEEDGKEPRRVSKRKFRTGALSSLGWNCYRGSLSGSDPRGTPPVRLSVGRSLRQDLERPSSGRDVPSPEDPLVPLNRKREKKFYGSTLDEKDLSCVLVRSSEPNFVIFRQSFPLTKDHSNVDRPCRPTSLPLRRYQDETRDLPVPTKLETDTGTGREIGLI